MAVWMDVQRPISTDPLRRALKTCSRKIFFKGGNGKFWEEESRQGRSEKGNPKHKILLEFGIVGPPERSHKVPMTATCMDVLACRKMHASLRSVGRCNDDPKSYIEKKYYVEPNNFATMVWRRHCRHSYYKENNAVDVKSIVAFTAIFLPL